MPRSGNDVQHRVERLDSRPHLAQKKVQRQHIGKVRERADEEQPPRFGGMRRRSEPIEIDAVGQANCVCWQDAVRDGHFAVGLRHRDHAIYPLPGGGFKWNPTLQLVAQFPVAALGQQLAVQIEGHVVLDQDGFGGSTVARILRHLREL